MRIILEFTPYIIVPLLITLLFKRYSLSWKWLTYLITAAIIFFYPFGLFWLDDYMNPPPPGLRCGTPQVGFLLGNIIIFLPITLILQFVFNKRLFNNINR
jgi:hypothetical protein